METSGASMDPFHGHSYFLHLLCSYHLRQQGGSNLDRVTASERVFTALHNLKQLYLILIT